MGVGVAVVIAKRRNRLAPNPAAATAATCAAPLALKASRASSPLARCRRHHPRRRGASYSPLAEALAPIAAASRPCLRDALSCASAARARWGSGDVEACEERMVVVRW